MGSTPVGDSESTKSNERLFYICLLSLALLDDSEVKINDVLGEGDHNVYRKNSKGIRDYIKGTIPLVTFER